MLSYNQYQEIQHAPPLQQTRATLTCPKGVLKCKGVFTATVNDIRLRFFVVETESDNLLGRTASRRMGFVQRLDAVLQPNDVFGDLNDQPVRCTPVKIKLKENAEPYSLYTARRVPIPLMEKIRLELDRMKTANIISEITEPTDWCTGMVPVLKKKTGAVRICCDLKKLNLAVKRERYMIPTIEDTLHKLKGSRIFSKLDATSGFYQIPLEEESAKLTTFITPFGRFFFKRLPFGISSAPEIFQEQ
ncbi:hypothetical protein ACOMHN_011610 [Nucella lapillus]